MSLDLFRAVFVTFSSPPLTCISVSYHFPRAELWPDKPQQYVFIPSAFSQLISHLLQFLYPFLNHVSISTCAPWVALHWDRPGLCEPLIPAVPPCPFYSHSLYLGHSARLREINYFPYTPLQPSIAASLYFSQSTPFSSISCILAHHSVLV